LTETDSGEAGGDSLEDLVRMRLSGPPPTMDNYGPYQVQMANGTFAYIERVANSAEASTLLLTPMGGTVLTYSLFVDETQAMEYFSLFVPASQAGIERPLLTAFHGFSTSHRDIDVRTSFFQEADQRDWYLVAPLQRNLTGPWDISYSSAQSQLHVEAVIGFVMEHYAIDKDRLYGVGFSMGGGGVMSYAARNRDRRRGAFAAVVNHTGSVALSNVYANLDPSSALIDVMELIFGGDPAEAPFEWLRSSLIEVDSQAALLLDGQHMAINLAHVPTQTWYNASDSLGYLVEQSIELDGYLQSLPGANHESVRVASSSACGSSQHCWGSLDQALACDWLEQQTLDSAPQFGSILADRSGRWEYFDLAQVLEGEFSRLAFEVDVVSNALWLSAPSNMASVTGSMSRLTLDSAQPLKLTLDDFGGTSTGFVIDNVATAPASVIREGAVLADDCSGGAATASSWCYDPAAQTLTLLEADPGAVTWRVNF
jgi:pimeloyl-ACP methyl ester carboxylesterase